MLEFQQLNVHKGQKQILFDVSGHCKTGQLVALIGENGAGKSTLLHTLAGQTGYQGQILLDGQALDSWSEQSLSIKRAVLNQHNQIPFDLGVPELVAMGRYPIVESNQQRQARVAYYLDLLQITSLTQGSVQQLSGGELQRVQMARCLAQLDAFQANSDNKLMLLDEPTSALDIKHQHRLLKLTREFVQRGNSAIVVLHDLNLASLYADHILLLSRGRIRQAGAPDQVLQSTHLQAVYQTQMHISQHPYLQKPMIFSEPEEIHLES